MSQLQSLQYCGYEYCLSLGRTFCCCFAANFFKCLHAKNIKTAYVLTRLLRKQKGFFLPQDIFNRVHTILSFISTCSLSSIICSSSVSVLITIGLQFPGKILVVEYGVLGLLVNTCIFSLIW